MSVLTNFPGLGRIIDALERKGPVTGQGPWECHCPCPGHTHDDARKSGRIWVTGERVCVWCYKQSLGHTWKEWVAALGVDKADWFSTKAPRRDEWVQREVVARHHYRDERGKVLFTVFRTEPKGFWQERSHVLDDGHSVTLQGLKGGWYIQDARDRWKYQQADPKPGQRAIMAPEVRRVIYRLPEIEALPLEEPVYLVEGEKAAEVLTHYGCQATTTAQGAQHFTPGVLHPLKGRHVSILPDADPDGFKHACTLAGACMMVLAASVRVVRWRKGEVPVGGDVQDWIRAVGLDGLEGRCQDRFFRETEPYGLSEVDENGFPVELADVGSAG